MKTLTVTLPETLATWLAGESQQTRSSRSAIVREALEQRRASHHNRDQQAKQPRNMAEALDSLGGTFRGPKDLATNPKYFEGFGK